MEAQLELKLRRQGATGVLPDAQLKLVQDCRPRMAPPLLTLKNVHVSFGSTPLLTGAELSVEPGDRICLVGRNGSGKSTLLKIAAGLIEPDDGERFVQPGRDGPLSAAGAGPRRLSPPRSPMSRPGSGRGDDPHRARYLLEQLGLTGDGRPGAAVGRRGAPRRAGPRAGARSPTSCCSTSRPTISTCRPSSGWKRELQRSRSALVLISHDRRFLETCRARPSGSTAA